MYYYYDASGSIGSINYNGVRYAFRKNLQGDIIAILDTSGNVVARYTYDAWGKVLSVTDATGNGMEITTADATLQALGIADFDVTKDFDLTQVDDALARVSAWRSGMGAQSNALEYAYRYSTNTRLNVTAGKSRLEDLDYGQAVSEQKKKQTLQQYAFFMQKKQMEQRTRAAANFLVS